MKSKKREEQFNSNWKVFDHSDMARLIGGTDPEYDVPPPRLGL